MLVPSEADSPVGAAGADGVWVTTIVLPLAETAKVPLVVHFVPIAMFAALAELPLMIVQVYALASSNPAGAEVGRLIVSVELAVTAPEAAILSQSVAPVPVMSQTLVPTSVAAPFTVSVPATPAVLPGLMVAPLAIVTAPTVPAPAKVAPSLTVTPAELPMEPLTSSVPAETTVLPE